MEVLLSVLLQCLLLAMEKAVLFGLLLGNFWRMDWGRGEEEEERNQERGEGEGQGRGERGDKGERIRGKGGQGGGDKREREGGKKGRR